jgi:hypothetical protein
VRLTPFVDRLKATGRKRVYGALELAGLKQQPGQLPAYFVVPEGSEAAPNTTIGVHDQLVTGTVLVVLVLEAAARREEAVSEQLHEEERAVIDAIAGWTPAGATRACDYLGGRLLSADGHTLSWAVRFRTAWRIRSIPSG